MIPLIAPILALVGVLTSAILGYYFGQQKMIAEHKKELTAEVWKKRCEYYIQLTDKMRKVPKWPSEQGKIKYIDLFDMSTDFKNWYFDGGGLFLTEQTRDVYRSVQRFVSDTLLDKHFEKSYPKMNEIVSPEDYVKMYAHLSRLRTSLTTDLLSREQDVFLEQKSK